MVFGVGNFNIKKALNYIDWKLLVFLLLFINIKLDVKIIALLFIYALQFNFKFGFKIKNSRLPLFYLLIIPIAFAALLINKNYNSHNYMPVFLTGIGFWVLSILAIHQIKLIVEKTETEKVHKTIVVFFIINAIISIGNLLIIMLITHSANPYQFKQMHQIYFMMTGDYIKGISFDISSTNAVLSAFGVIYFLVKKMPAMLIICMCTLLLTYSNLINLILLFTVFILFVFKSTRDQKSMIVVCLMLFITFMVKVSPENKNYAIEVIKDAFHLKKTIYKPIVAKTPAIEKPYYLLTTEEKRQQIAWHYLDSLSRVIAKYKHKQKTYIDKYIPLNNNGRVYIKGPDTNSEDNWISKGISADQKPLLDFISAHKAELPISSQKNYVPPLPGKALGVMQTAQFFRAHPGMLVAGVGVGNFSSKIAYRATGLGIRGLYPENYTYINKAFLVNHLDLYLSYFSKYVGFRSVSNSPFSVYDQLLAEYGLLGLLCLLIFYFGFFLKSYKNLTYGIPLIMFVAAIFFTDYWFEQLSVMVIFELLLFVNIKENQVLVKVKQYTEDKFLVHHLV